MSALPHIDLSAIPEDQRDAVAALMRETASLKEINKRLEHLVAELNHVVHGKKSEKLDEDDRQLAFEDLQIAVSEAEEHKQDQAPGDDTPKRKRVAEHLKASTKLFMDETTAPVLDPGRGRTKTGYLWALARDDRRWGSADPPGVVFFYAPDRGGKNAETFLRGFDGILQLDGYTGYNRLTRPSREGGDPIRVAHCWAHARRKLKEVFDRDGSEIAAEGLRRIAELYQVEADIRGIDPGQRLSARQARTVPLVAAFGDWLQEQRLRVSAKSRLGEKLTYIHRHWDGLQTFLHDGRVEIDSNGVENLIRPIALNRKDALFAGHDEGGKDWGSVASLIETAKINGVEPFA